MAYGGTRVIKGKDGNSYVLQDLGDGKYEVYRKVGMRDLSDALGVSKTTSGAQIWRESVREDLLSLLTGGAAAPAAADAPKAAPVKKRKKRKMKATAKAAAKPKTKAKAKKRVGRPPKKAVGRPPKKRVGRPPKSATAAADAPKKRGPGRPRKVRPEEAAPAAASAAPAEGAKPKRKRAERHGRITEEVTKAFDNGRGITNSGAMLRYLEEMGLQFNRSTVYTMMSNLRRQIMDAPRPAPVETQATGLFSGSAPAAPAAPTPPPSSDDSYGD